MKSDIFKKQVYAGISEILNDSNLYYNSRVGSNYSHLTEEGKEAIVNYINIVGPHILALEEKQIEAKAKSMVWNELTR